MASVSSQFTFLSVVVLLPAANEAGVPLWTWTGKPKHASITILGAAKGGEWPAAPPFLFGAPTGSVPSTAHPSRFLPGSLEEEEAGHGGRRVLWAGGPGLGV